MRDGCTVCVGQSRTIAQRKIGNVAQDEERNRSEHTGIGIRLFPLGRLNRRKRFGAASLIDEVDIADAQILNGMTRNPVDDRAQTPTGIRAYDVANVDAADDADGRVIGTARAVEVACLLTRRIAPAQTY